MQKIIDIYGELYVKILLQNKNELERLYVEAYKAREGRKNTHQEVENIQMAVDFYVMNKVLSKKIDNKSLENYKKVFNKMIREDIMLVFRNPLLKLPKEKLITIMDDKTYESLQKRKQGITKRCKEIFQKDNKRVTKEEKEFLLDYLQANIGTRDKEIITMQEELLHQIFTIEETYGYKETDFVVNFISTEEMKKYNLEGYCHLSNYKPGKAIRYNESEKSESVDLRATINKDFGIKAINSKNDIGKLLHTICYQIKILEQTENIQKGIRNEETLNYITEQLLETFSSKENYAYYKENYSLESSEISAQSIGYSNAITYLKKYGNPIQISNLLEEKDNYFSIKILKNNQNKKKENVEQFKRREIGNIIKNHKELLQIYPQLQMIYKEDGTQKNLQQLLIEKGGFKEKNKKDKQNIYHSTIDALIDENELENIDFSSMNKEEIYKTMHALSEQYNYYATASHNYLSVKAIGEEFAKQSTSVKEDLDKNINIMKSRYQKIETILDILYNRFGESYREITPYKKDQFIYQKDKIYARYKFHKINKNRQSIELTEMVEEQHEVNQASSKK